MIEHALPIWVHALDEPMLEDHGGDEPQHIAQLLHGGQLPVVTMAAASDCPGEERDANTGRKRDCAQGTAVRERAVTNIGQRMRECERAERLAIAERTCTDAGERVRQCERSEPDAVIESLGLNTG